MTHLEAQLEILDDERPAVKAPLPQRPSQLTQRQNVTAELLANKMF